MTLSQDEIREIFEKHLRCTIDIDQGMNYCLDSKYEAGIDNFLAAIKSLEYIIQKIRD